MYIRSTTGHVPGYDDLVMLNMFVEKCLPKQRCLPDCGVRSNSKPTLVYWDSNIGSILKRNRSHTSDLFVFWLWIFLDLSIWHSCWTSVLNRTKTGLLREITMSVTNQRTNDRTNQQTHPITIPPGGDIIQEQEILYIEWMNEWMNEYVYLYSAS